MPHTRSNNAQEILTRLHKMYKFYIPTSGGVSDTTGALLAKGDDEITMTTFASWNTGDWVIIVGSGGMDLLQLGTKPGSSAPFPLVGRPPAFAQASGALVYKATRVDLGYIEDAGAQLGASASKQGIGAANAGGAIAYIDGDTPEITFSWTQRESSLRDIATAFGIDEDAITGTGVSNDPYVLTISGDAIGSQSNYCLRTEARKVNNKLQAFDVLNAFPEVNVSAAIVGKGSPTTWGCAVKATAVVAWDQP